MPSLEYIPYSDYDHPMKACKTLTIGKIILVICVMGFLFLFFTIGQWIVPGVWQIRHPMHTAITYNWPPVVRVLSYAGLKNARAYGIKGECRTALQQAVSQGSVEIVGILLNRGASLKGCGRKETIFSSYPSSYNILAGSIYHPDLLEHLLTEEKFDPLYKDSLENEYAIFDAVGCPSRKRDGSISQDVTKSLEIFLKHGVDPSIVSGSARYDNQYGGPIPLLTKAAFSKCAQPVKILLEHGADPVAAEISLREFFKRQKVHDQNSAYKFQSDSFFSEEVKENIRLIKRAAGK